MFVLEPATAFTLQESGICTIPESKNTFTGIRLQGPEVNSLAIK